MIKKKSTLNFNFNYSFILKLIFDFFRKLNDEINLIRFAAASLAFSTLFAALPFLIIIFALFQYIGGLDRIYPQVELLILNYFKEATGSTVTGYLKSAISKAQSRTLGFTGLVILLVSTFGLFRNIDLAFHQIWKIRPQKSFLKRLWLHILIIVSLPALIAIYIGLQSTKILNSLSFFKFNKYGLQSSSLFFIALALWIIMTVIPDHKVSKILSLICASLTAFVLALIQKSFLWMALIVFKKNKIYGSIASFPIFLLWLLVIWTVILSGVSLCAFLHRRFKPA